MKRTLTLGLLLALAVIVWCVRLLRSLLLGLAAGAVLAAAAHATPLPDPPPGAGPVVLLPACHVPVARRSWVTITINGRLICASQVRPRHHHKRRHR